MKLGFEGCPEYVIGWQKSCGNDAVGVMNGLIIKENNSILKRAVIFENGEVKDQFIVVPENMDQMYLKLETIDNGNVNPL